MAMTKADLLKQLKMVDGKWGNTQLSQKDGLGQADELQPIKMTQFWKGGNLVLTWDSRKLAGTEFELINPDVINRDEALLLLEYVTEHDLYDLPQYEAGVPERDLNREEETDINKQKQVIFRKLEPVLDELSSVGGGKWELIFNLLPGFSNEEISFSIAKDNETDGFTASTREFSLNYSAFTLEELTVMMQAIKQRVLPNSSDDFNHWLKTSISNADYIH